MQHDEGQFAGAGGLRLYYQRWRPETTPARGVVVLVHGDFAQSSWYMNLPTHEVPRGYAVYAPDRRGWGRSLGQRGWVRSWGEYLDDLDALLALVRAEEPGRPLFLMGHTGSSPIVLEYALRHPQGIHGVFCISPVMSMSGQVSPVMLRLVHILSRIGPRVTIDVTRQFDASAAEVSHDPAFVKFIREDPLRNTKVTPRWLAESDAAMRRVNAEAPKFLLPLLILQGGAESNFAKGASTAYFRRVGSADKTLREYPGAYINLLSETNYEEVLGDIDGWLDAHV